eukprot:6197475-Pleurochrysis_carterae.AAC.3
MEAAESARSPTGATSSIAFPPLSDAASERGAWRKRVCECADNAPPPGEWTCEQQALFGKCNESWMAPPVCMGWCHQCGELFEGDT